MAQKNDTFNVYFATGQRVLDATNIVQAKKILPWINSNRKLLILGYTDRAATDSFNLRLSDDRAKAVAAYLKSHGVAGSNLTNVRGMGKLNQQGDTDTAAADRKVMVIALANADEKLSVAVQNAKVNETIQLKNILFEGDRHHFLVQSLPTLDSLFSLMQQNPKLTIGIEGHICCLSPEDGQDKMDNDSTGWLSETRARAVYNFLVTKGIKASRMTYKGMGFKQPLVFPEVTEQDQMNNRRVEIRILSR